MLPLSVSRRAAGRRWPTLAPVTRFANPLAEHVWRSRYRFEDEPSIDATLRPRRRARSPRPSRTIANAGRSASATRSRLPLPARRTHPRRRGHRTARHADELLRHGHARRFARPASSPRCRGARSRCSRAAASAPISRRCAPRARRPTRPAVARSGPVSFMQLWEQMCATVTDTSPRRGAMMGVMACDHPDIHAFVAAKRVAGKLTHFNVSVLVYDAFMRAVAADGPVEARLSRASARALDARARPVGRDRRRRVRVGGAGRAVHRPHPRRGQPGVLRDDQRDQSLRRDPAAALRRLRPRLGQPRHVRPRPVHADGAARPRRDRRARADRRAHARQRLER